MRVKTQVQQSPLRPIPIFGGIAHHGILRKRPSIVAGGTSCHNRASTPDKHVISSVPADARPSFHSRPKPIPGSAARSVCATGTQGAQPHTLTTGVDSAFRGAGMPVIVVKGRYRLHGVHRTLRPDRNWALNHTL